MTIETISSSNRTLLRIDDISINLNGDRLESLLTRFKNKYPMSQLLLAVSPAVFDMSKQEKIGVSERIFPSILNAHSDHRVFYEIEKIGIPDWIPNLQKKFDATLASHGLIHVDHRLLDYSAQEMSILTSVSLIRSKIFVPPFNKYNLDTRKICEEHHIDLVKWEDNWQHLSFQEFNDDGRNYYMHLHDFPGDKIDSLFQ